MCSLLGLLEVSTLYKRFKEPAAVTDDVAGCCSLSPCKWVSHVLSAWPPGSYSNGLEEEEDFGIVVNKHRDVEMGNIDFPRNLVEITIPHDEGIIRFRPRLAPRSTSRAWTPWPKPQAGSWALSTFSDWQVPSSIWSNLFATLDNFHGDYLIAASKLSVTAALVHPLEACRITSKGGVTTTGSEC